MKFIKMIKKKKKKKKQRKKTKQQQQQKTTTLSATLPTKTLFAILTCFFESRNLAAFTLVPVPLWTVVLNYLLIYV